MKRPHNFICYLGVLEIMGQIPIPSSYYSWRLSQGFEEGAIPLLYSKIDSSNLAELNVFLETQKITNMAEFDINIAVRLLNKMGGRIRDHGSKDMKEFMVTVTSISEEMLFAFHLGMLGRYEAAFILMRSCFEGLLRMTFNGLKVKESYFQTALSKRTWPTKIGNKKVDWDDPLKVEKASSIFEMCVLLDKIELARPIKPLYEFLEIGRLNKHTHRNILQVIDSDSLLFNKSKRGFNQNKIDLLTLYYRRYSELWLIIMQNSADYIQPVFEPLVHPNNEIQVSYPMFYQLIFDRAYSMANCGRKKW